MSRNLATGRFMVALGVALCAGGYAAAQPQPESALSEPEVDPIGFRKPNAGARFDQIKIEQKLNAQIPLDLKFRDESGNEVALAQYFGEKPVVLSLVYYECPMLCNLILNGMVAGFDGEANTLDIGRDYTVLSVSIDPGEKPALAAAKKSNYLEQYHRPGGGEGWHFLTGDQAAIEDLAMAVGYRYYYDPATDQYAHASGIAVLTPQGRVSSYYLGIEYLPQVLKLAIVDAAGGKIGSLKDQLVLLCYAYDPASGSYGFYVMGAVRLGGGAVVIALLVFWALNGWSNRTAGAATAA